MNISGAVTTAAVDASTVPWAALLPLVLFAVAFVAYCLIDLARSEVRYLPKWAWAVVCCVSVPLGGIVYLFVGRAPTHGEQR
jgi:hypothetical protein